MCWCRCDEVTDERDDHAHDEIYDQPWLIHLTVISLVPQWDAVLHCLLLLSVSLS